MKRIQRATLWAAMAAAAAVSLSATGDPTSSATARDPLSAPAAQLDSHGPHSLNLEILGIDTSARHVRIRAYVHAGATPPGTGKQPPSSTPIYQCRAAQCPKNHVVVVRHLRDLGVYSASTYATDSTGRSSRQTAVGQVATDGIYLGDHDLLASNSSAGSEAVRDGSGTMHLIVGTRYYTRERGTRRWTITKFDTGKHRPAHFPGAIESVGLSLNGKRVYFVVTTCDGLAVAEPSIGATRLGRPSVALAADVCGGKDGRRRLVGGAVALPHGRIGLLVGADFIVGRPGGDWQTETLPDVAPNTGFGALTRDAATGEVLAVGYSGVSGRLDVDVWSRLPGAAWHGPVVAASLPEPQGPIYRSSGIVADRGRAWIAFTRSVPYGQFGQTHDTMLILTRHDGAWSAPTELPRSVAPANDLPPVLALNPATHHLHLAYSHARGFLVTRHTRAEGIVHQFLKAGKWSAPRHLTHFWRDEPQNLMFNDAGHVVIVVARRA